MTDDTCSALVSYPLDTLLRNKLPPLRTRYFEENCPLARGGTLILVMVGRHQPETSHVNVLVIRTISFIG